MARGGSVIGLEHSYHGHNPGSSSGKNQMIGKACFGLFQVRQHHLVQERRCEPSGSIVTRKTFASTGSLH
jgi:hypothetical protein